jgi:arabinose-5-phosphate isomerase
MQLALGDALAMAVMDMRGVSKSQLHAFHPGGNIGLQLTPISELMHGADALPLVREHARMPEVISVMTAGRFGLAGVVDDAGNLLGVITDGDLRRHFDSIATARAADVMTRSPKSMPMEMLAVDALLFLNDAKITAAFVLDGVQRARPIGILHIHDLLRFGLN